MMMLMPATPGTCPECATKHEPQLPHNQQSLYYQSLFYSVHGRWPTWDDAMAHCSLDVREVWTQALRERGIDVGGGESDADS
ncbi:hypothetical protein ACE3MS_21440 [Paenibacillus dendritiformis]|uniref:hypothetical protein n=1 Tax=Paenibacillus dendritiformis TaxID=130049 RepID=UPI0036698C1D